jgi:sugar transferase (PEP-CTERM/EpsH1 system associated)
LRVCHLTLGLGIGGLERLLVEFARHHDRSRYELHVASLSTLGPLADDIRQAGVTLHALPDRQGRKAAQLVTLIRFLRRLRPDVLHTHNAYSHLYGAVAGRLVRTGGVIHTRHGLALTGGAFESALFRLSCLLSDAVVSVSDELCSLSRAQGCPAAKSHRIWNGIDTALFQPVDKPAQPTLICVGRLEAVKDLPTLLRALALAREDLPALELLVVGDGSARDPLEDMSRSLGLEKSVSFLGARDDVSELLRRATVFVSSSLSEGVALALLEAMAAGLPAVVTRVGGNVEVVQDGVTGLLVPPGDPGSLAAAIVALLGDPSRAVMMGRAARSRVEEWFDVRRMVRDYERLYSTLAAR